MASDTNKKSRNTISRVPQGVQEEDGDSINILELLYRLFDKKWLIVAMAVAGLALMMVYSFFIAKPQYSATSKLYVLSSDEDSIISLSSLQMGTSLASDYMRIFDIREVREEVARNLEDKYNLKLTTSALSNMVSVSNPSSTRFLYITATSGDPQTAANVANEYKDVVINAIKDIMGTARPHSASDAEPPRTPVSPNKTMNAVIGTFVGALLAVLIITLQFILDVKIKTSDDIRRYAGLATLAIIPVMQGSQSGKKKKHSSKLSVNKKGAK